MSHLRTVVEIEQQAYDGKDRPLSTEGKPMEKPSDEPMLRKEKYYLLYWGEEYTILGTVDNPIPVHYTVGICQNMETGQIETFLPSAIKVIGKEFK